MLETMKEERLLFESEASGKVLSVYQAGGLR